MTNNLTPQQRHILREMASGLRLTYRIGEGWRVGDEPVNGADVHILDSEMYIDGMLGYFVITGWGRRIAMQAETEADNGR